MNDALERSKGKFLTDEENSELKKLYRKIVKAMQPDINPDVSEAQVNLFDNAVPVSYTHLDVYKRQFRACAHAAFLAASANQWLCFNDLSYV